MAAQYIVWTNIIVSRTPGEGYGERVDGVRRAFNIAWVLNYDPPAVTLVFEVRFSASRPPPIRLIYRRRWSTVHDFPKGPATAATVLFVRSLGYPLERFLINS